MYDISELTYTTHDNPEWFTRALFGGRLLSGGYVRALTGIKGDELLKDIDLSGRVLQSDGRDCAWTPQQIFKLSEKTAKVKTYKINLEQCIDELENKRTLYELSPGAKNESLPSELEEATLWLLAINLSNEIEELIVAGDEATNPDEFDGMVTLLRKSTGAIKIKGEAITKENVLDAFEEVYMAIPENVLQAEKTGTLYMLCSYATRRALRAALSDKNNQVIAASWMVDDADKKNPRIYYMGVEIVPAQGVDNSTIVGYDSNNALFLTDLMSDLEQIELGNFPKPNEDKVFVKGRLRLGFAIPFEDEVVLWSAETDGEASGAKA